MDAHRESSGVRRRFVQAAAPAPVPEQTPKGDDKCLVAQKHDRSLLQEKPMQKAHSDQSALSAAQPKDDTKAQQVEGTQSTEEEKAAENYSTVVRSTGSMAIATLFSRITGFLRNVVIVTTLGSAISSAFNTANTLPNLITEIVLGAVLTSLVIPVLVRAEKEDPDRGERFVRQLFTLATALLGSITIISVLAAPFLTRLMLKSDGKVNVIQATNFAYLLLPQIIFYGLFALLMAVLNTKGVFKPGAWAPVANNVIGLAVMLAYRFLPGQLSPSEPASLSDPHILLLGLGTTLGVVVQMLILLPAIRRSGISLKPLWGIDARLKEFAGMALAIVVYVAISQFGYSITTRIASSADGGAPNIYQQAWLLLQMPYGIIGVTLLTAIMPRLSRNAADGDNNAVVKDLVLGSKLTYLALIPIVVFFTAFGTPIATGLFAYGEFDHHDATILGMTLSFSAFTLLPYATVLLHLRVFYAREEAWTPTFIIAGITVTKVLLSCLAPLLANRPENVVILLAAANGFGFISGAVIGGFLLRRKLGSLGSATVMRSVFWALGASGIGVIAALGCSWALNALGTVLPVVSSLGSAHHIIFLLFDGTVFLLVTGIVLSRSKLEEVNSIARSLTRIPGLNKIIRVSPVGEQETPQLNAQSFVSAEALAFDDSFNSTPVPPPMSAGIVHGPRLIAGAEVSAGRFRLLAAHGGVTGARFWQAKESATGREVALVFVDLSKLAAQDSPRNITPTGLRIKIAQLNAQVTRRTRVLAALNHPAIASGIAIEPYGDGVLIIADWVPGRSLSSIAQTNPNPYAAAYAFEPLAQAVTKAHEIDTPLGLDNRARIRISTEGHAVLAFPAVLPGTHAENDLRGIRAGLGQLIDPETAPADIAALMHTPPEQLPEKLAGLELPHADVDEKQPTALAVTEDKAPRPANVPGFGRAGYSNKGIGILTIVAVVLVLICALLTAYLTTLLSHDSNDAPISADNIVGSKTQAVPSPELIRPISSVQAWAQDPTMLSQDSVNSSAFTIDGDPQTSWLVHSQQGLEVRTVVPGIISELEVTTVNDQPMDVKVYGIVDEEQVDSVNNLPLLAEKTLTTTENSITLSSKQQLAGVLLYITSAPEDNQNAIVELAVIGN
ncbi:MULTISPECIES: murein biosynthesis integral membrane protein MurJ [unclassified Corynebacterium]|uniref:murein biosynthesis integral membrane protein MurJ n=1 Tax=unclassified Corynebacterium TaxID=2624378 RepID=UPI00210223A3|nr:murein biosynthesis integral membrane protein MurJ [Corynebacterium sp. SY003]